MALLFGVLALGEGARDSDWDLSQSPYQYDFSGAD
jgi:hypothetical protein